MLNKPFTMYADTGIKFFGRNCIWNTIRCVFWSLAKEFHGSTFRAVYALRIDAYYACMLVRTDTATEESGGQAQIEPKLLHALRNRCGLLWILFFSLVSFSLFSLSSISCLYTFDEQCTYYQKFFTWQEFLPESVWERSFGVHFSHAHTHTHAPQKTLSVAVPPVSLVRIFITTNMWKYSVK